MSKNNFIIDQFRAAKKLIYEWQDTAGTLALGIGVAVGNHFFGPISIPIGTFLATSREFGRLMYWEQDDTRLRLVNDLPSPPGLSGPPDNDALCFAAGTVGGVLLTGTLSMIPAVLFRLSLSPLPKEEIMTMVVFSSCGMYFLAGGFRGIAQSYGYMWDWPRKNGGDGGGTTQTQIVKDGAAALWKKAKDRVRSTRPSGKPTILPPGTLPQPI